MIIDHLSLRAVEPQDLDEFFAHEQDEEALRMAAFTPENPADREAFMAHWQRILANDTVVTRTVTVDGKVAGHIASWVQEGAREVTYWIDRAWWGRGVATAALRLLLEELSDRPLFARAAADNTGSIRVLEKNGFVIVAKERGYANARQSEIDEFVLRLSGP